MEKFSIKAIRINLNKSQEEMAKILNITPRAYSDKENGKSRWYFDEVLKICDLADMSISKVKA